VSLPTFDVGRLIFGKEGSVTVGRQFRARGSKTLCTGGKMGQERLNDVQLGDRADRYDRISGHEVGGH